MSMHMTFAAVQDGTRIWPAASGETGVAFMPSGTMYGVAEGYWRVARFELKHAALAWRWVGVAAPQPPAEAPSEVCRFSGWNLFDGLESDVQRLIILGDLPRRREEWAEACADVRMGWDGDEP